jgi:hypothetical protein
MLPKTLRYRADSIRLNCTSEDVILNSGFTEAAAFSRVARAVAAVSIEIESSVKWAATEFQIVELKSWLSPKYISFRLRLPSCSITGKEVRKRFQV